MRSLSLSTWILLATITAVAACFNPVHSNAVAALGPEAPGVHEGETHRPGQPCLVCHGGDGPGPDFAVGGTIYATREGAAPLPGVDVVLTDSAGVSKTLRTNQVGNFYLPKANWTPAFPMFVRLDYKGGAKPISSEMVTRIGGEGGCAFCHYGANNEASHMPHVYMSEK